VEQVLNSLGHTSVINRDIVDELFALDSPTITGATSSAVSGS